MVRLRSEGQLGRTYSAAMLPGFVASAPESPLLIRLALWGSVSAGAAEGMRFRLCDAFGVCDSADMVLAKAGNQVRCAMGPR